MDFALTGGHESDADLGQAATDAGNAPLGAAHRPALDGPERGLSAPGGAVQSLSHHVR